MTFEVSEIRKSDFEVSWHSAVSRRVGGRDGADSRVILFQGPQNVVRRRCPCFSNRRWFDGSLYSVAVSFSVSPGPRRGQNHHPRNRSPLPLTTRSSNGTHVHLYFPRGARSPFFTEIPPNLTRTCSSRYLRTTQSRFIGTLQRSAWSLCRENCTLSIVATARLCSSRELMRMAPPRLRTKPFAPIPGRAFFSLRSNLLLTPIQPRARRSEGCHITRRWSPRREAVLAQRRVAMSIVLQGSHANEVVGSGNIRRLHGPQPPCKQRPFSG